MPTYITFTQDQLDKLLEKNSEKSMQIALDLQKKQTWLTMKQAAEKLPVTHETLTRWHGNKYKGHYLGSQKVISEYELEKLICT